MGKVFLYGGSVCSLSGIPSLFRETRAHASPRDASGRWRHPSDKIGSRTKGNNLTSCCGDVNTIRQVQKTLREISFDED